MSLYNEILAADATIFSNPSLMPGVEPIDYTPAGEVSRPLTVTIMHGVPKDQGGEIVLMTTIFVPVTLIPTPTVKGDRVRARDQRGDLKDYRVSEILTSDAGGYMLRLE